MARRPGDSPEEELLRTMPDASAFMWSLDGIDPGGKVRAWMDRRASLLGRRPPQAGFTFRILPVTKESLAEEMLQEYKSMSYSLRRMKWLYEQAESAPAKDADLPADAPSLF